MAERPSAEGPMEEEAEHFTGGPGVVATKSQAQGGLAGGLAGAVLGALIGAVLGAIVLDGRGTVIVAVSFAVAGAVAGGVAGGITRSMNKTEGGAADR